MTITFTPEETAHLAGQSLRWDESGARAEHEIADMIRDKLFEINNVEEDA